MKQIATLLFCFFLGCSLYAQESISFIKSDNSWHFIYDENGRKVTTLSKSYVGEVVGWGHDFFVAEQGSWVYIFDMKGHKIVTLSKSYTGKVIAVSSTTFTCQSGSWLYIFDRNGKKLQTMSAR